MSGNIKINPDIAQGVAGKFGQNASQLDAIISSLNSQVASNVGTGKPGWEGRQASEFENSWNTEFKPSLTKLRDALTGAQDLLNKTIQAYRTLDS